MPTRVLITGAGSGATNNLVRSLRSADPPLRIVGCHDDRFVLRKSLADRNYLIPPASTPDFAGAVRRLVRRERIDVLIPTDDAAVKALSDRRKSISCRLFLPQRATIDLCQDKCDLAVFLRARGIPAPATVPVKDLDRLADLFRRLPRASTVWCRVRAGSRSFGATSVRNPRQARAWIRYWAEMRGVAPNKFTLCEYLPGRDFLCQSIWKDGALILVTTFERLAYFGGESSPSGVSSLSSLAKTVVDHRIVEVCTQAIRAIDPKASGAFSIDLKEDARGVPCVTEINAGRFFIGMTAFDHIGKHNMSLLYVRLALGEPVGLRDEYDAVEGYYLVRDLDTPPGVFHADDLFAGIEEA